MIGSLSKVKKIFHQSSRWVGNGTVLKSGTSSAPIYRRYLSNRESAAEEYLSAARSYVTNKQADEQAWLHCKPYDVNPGNPGFFTEMYQVMNLLKAMEIPFRGKILEVGSGPGWITEILVALGYEVHGLEPCEDMIAIAKERVAKAIGHWQINNPPPYEFVCETLEDCTLPSEQYDAIFFHAALHHVIDEKSGISQCCRLLKPGGKIGISEAAWEPGNRGLEAALDEEMARFGTLENPYTREYLDYLLADNGFTDIRRYHALNGLIPETLGASTIESLADAPASTSNNLTAVKEGVWELTTRNDLDHTAARIRILAWEYVPEKYALNIELELENIGRSTWLHQAERFGWVTIAVRTDPLGGIGYAELNRHNLPRDIKPGETLRSQFRFETPGDFAEKSWYLDLVNEENVLVFHPRNSPGFD